jgi:hypothetical protein
VESCTHCGREVKPTVHRRRGEKVYEVDYYRLVTGELSRVAMQNPRDESEMIEFYKLDRPRLVVTCVDCFGKDAVRKELDGLFAGVPEEMGDKQEEG